MLPGAEAGGFGELVGGRVVIAESVEGETEVVVGGLVAGRTFNGGREPLAGLGEVAGAVAEDTHAGESAAVFRVAGEGALEERFCLAVVVEIGGDLAQLVEGFGLDGLQLDGLLKLVACLWKPLLHHEEVAETVVGGGVSGAKGEVGAQIFFGGGVLGEVELDVATEVEDGGVVGVECAQLASDAVGGIEPAHLLVEDGKVVEEARVARSEVLGAGEVAERRREVSAGTRRECELLAAADLASLGGGVVGGLCEEGFVGIAGAGGVARREARGSRGQRRHGRGGSRRELQSEGDQQEDQRRVPT